MLTSMTKRLLVLAALGSLALWPTGGFAAPGGGGEGVKKLKGVLERLGQVKGPLATSDPLATEASAAFEAAGKQNDPEAAKALLGLLVTPFPQSPAVELFVAEQSRDALVALEAAPARDEVRSALDKKKRDPAFVVPIARVVAAWNEEASARSLAALLESRDPQVIEAGARGLGTLGRKEGVRPLIAAFGALHDQGGEVLEAVGHALLAITGQAFKTMEDWNKWWGGVEATWDPSQKQASTDGGTRVHFQPTDPPVFESVAIRSTKVVFILDVSGSMHIRNFIEDPVAEGAAPPAGGTDRHGGGVSLGGAPALPPGVDPRAPGYKRRPCTFAQCPGAKGTGPECPSDENLPTYYRRHDRLMRQVQKVLRELRPNVQFNMIAFSTDARAWHPGGLAQADERNKRSASQFVDALQPNGATSADKALDLAFTMEDADTFVFVTDGAPTNPAGRPYDEGRWRDLLDAVKVKNKTRNVKIDVIAIAEGSTGFSRMLANENGGTFTTVP